MKGHEPHLSSSVQRRWAQFYRVLRALVFAVGVSGFGGAVLIAARPGIASRIPTESVIRALGSDYFVVAAIGLGVVGCGVILLGARLRDGITEATPAVVEEVQSAVYPGMHVDQTDGRSLSGLGDGDDRNHRRDLRRAAIRATKAQTGCTRQDATQLVENGSWTRDQVASTYLAVGSPQSESVAPAQEPGGAAAEPPVARTLQAITQVAAKEPQTTSGTRAASGESE